MQQDETGTKKAQPGRPITIWTKLARLTCHLTTAVALLFAAPGAWAESAPERIRALAADSARTTRVAASYDERFWLDRFYAVRGYAPAWSGASEQQASVALELLRDARAHGLDASDYDPRAIADQMPPQAAPPAQRSADLDAGLTLAVLRYLADLHAGRVLSSFAPPQPDTGGSAFDPVAALQHALSEQRLEAAIEAAEPRLPIYHRLKLALRQYRELATHPMAPLPPLPAGRKTIAMSAAYKGAGALRERLALLGDLQPDSEKSNGKSYTAPLADAVKRFQGRHGLDADGRLGRQTLAALNVPLEVRVRQIELSLERLRWLPDLAAGPFIAINLPSYHLWAFKNGAADPQPALAMRVIVGKALHTPTPLFIGTLRHLEFNPYWNVPISIQRDEILPALLRDPHYLDRQNMEVVNTRGGTSQSVDSGTIASLRAGTSRVRQRPGPRNALGAVKFVLPNSMSIYLHSTPAKALFARSRRDFSHGCIRVEDPAALASFVLSDQARWTPEAIETAMAPGPTRTVQLKSPMPVVIFYTTAIVDHDGQVMFPDDVYQLDEALERQLAARGKSRVW